MTNSDFYTLGVGGERHKTADKSRIFIIKTSPTATSYQLKFGKIKKPTDWPTLILR